MEGTFQIIFHLQLTQQFRVDQEVQAGPGLPVQQIGKKKNISLVSLNARWQQISYGPELKQECKKLLATVTR